MNFLINGKAISDRLDLRTSLARSPARSSRSPARRRAAIRVPAGPARCSSTAGASIHASRSRCSTRAARSPPSKGLAEAGELHPLQQAFIAHDGFQCGYCTPGQICSAIGMADEFERGVPSDVTADLATIRCASTCPTRAARADERQSVPLRRAQRHRRGDRMKRSPLEARR